MNLDGCKRSRSDATVNYALVLRGSQSVYTWLRYIVPYRWLIHTIQLMIHRILCRSTAPMATHSTGEASSSTTVTRERIA